MNVSSLVNKQAYTDKGNQYNKFSGGKKVGALAATGFAVTNIAIMKDLHKAMFEEVKKFKYGRTSYITGLAIGTGLLLSIGTGIGAIVDAIVNKTRKAKADKTGSIDAQA